MTSGRQQRNIIGLLLTLTLVVSINTASNGAVDTGTLIRIDGNTDNSNSADREIIRNVVISPEGGYIADIVNSFGAEDGDCDGRIVFRDCSGRILFERMYEPEDGWGRSIEHCIVMRNGTLVLVQTTSFVGKNCLEIIDKKGDTVSILEGTKRNDLWMAPSGEYVLIRKVVNWADNGMALVSELKRVNLDGTIETICQFAPSFSIQPTGLSATDTYFIVLTNSAKGDEYNKLLTFNGCGLLWSDEFRYEGGYTAFFSNYNRYVIVAIGINDEIQGNSVLKWHKEYRIYLNPLGQLIYRGILDEEQLHKYVTESIEERD